MGTRVIIRKNGITYLGGDVHSDVKHENLNQYNTGVQIISPELIIAKMKDSKVLNLLDIYTEWFKLNENEKMTKELVLKNIVNPLYLEAKKRNLIDNDTQMMDASFYVICKDVTYQVLSTFQIIEVHDYACSSYYEEMIIYPYLYAHDQIENPKDIIHYMMKSLYEHISYIQESYFLFNNQDMEFHLYGGF